MQTLYDLDHYFANDVASSNTGDLQTATGLTRSQQRILRRLLTNPGDYIFHPDYGAGLPKQIGEIADIKKITSLIRGQVLLEDSVARTPEPVINVQAIPNGLAVSIKYVDAPSGQSVALNFNVNK